MISARDLLFAFPPIMPVCQFPCSARAVAIGRPIVKTLLFLNVLLGGLAGQAADAPLKLRFFIVSQVPGARLRFFDEPGFPRLGYIAGEPDLVITELEAVSSVVSHGLWRVVDKNGKVVEVGNNGALLEIRFTERDAKSLEVLSGSHRGEQMLMMLGDDPLMAPIIRDTIGATVQVTLRVGADPEILKRRLEALVRKTG